MKKLIIILLCCCVSGFLHSQVNQFPTRMPDGEDNSQWQVSDCQCPPPVCNDDDDCTDDVFNEETCECEYLFNCSCDIESELIDQGFIALHKGILNVTELNNIGGIVDEYAQINSPSLDVNSDIKNHLNFLSNALPDIKGIIQSIEDCGQPIISLSEDNDASRRILSGEFMLIVHVVVTKVFNDSDIIWIKIHDNLEPKQRANGYAKIWLLPLNDGFDISKIHANLHEMFAILPSADNYDIEYNDQVGVDFLFDRDAIVLIGSGGPQSELIAEVKTNYDCIATNIDIEDFKTSNIETDGGGLLERGHEQIAIVRTDLHENDFNSFNISYSDTEEMLAWLAFHALGHAAGWLHWKPSTSNPPPSMIPLLGTGYMDHGFCIEEWMTAISAPPNIWCSYPNPCIGAQDEDSNEFNDDVCPDIRYLINVTDEVIKTKVINRFNN